MITRTQSTTTKSFHTPTQTSMAGGVANKPDKMDGFGTETGHNHALNVVAHGINQINLTMPHKEISK